MEAANQINFERCVYYFDKEKKELGLDVAGMKMFKWITSKKEALIDLLSSRAVDIVVFDIEPDANIAPIVKKAVLNISFIIVITDLSSFDFSKTETIPSVYLKQIPDKKKLFKLINELKIPSLPPSTASKEVRALRDNPTSLERGKIFVKNINKLHVIELKDLTHINSSGNYSIFNMINGEKIVASKNLKNYQSSLVTFGEFIRVHRCFIVNKNYIHKIETKSRSTKIIMSNGSKIDVAFIKKNDIMQKLFC